MKPVNKASNGTDVVYSLSKDEAARVGTYLEAVQLLGNAYAQAVRAIAVRRDLSAAPDMQFQPGENGVREVPAVPIWIAGIGLRQQCCWPTS